MIFEGSRLLESLIKVSEKAANIARVCRQNDHLFKLLVQEKSSDEKNPRFIKDFKTLADVLIQETIKYDIGNEFPDIRDEVRGEENNTFSNTLGESVTVKVCSTFEETAILLEKVLNNDTEAAGLLATEVHRDIQLDYLSGDKNLPNDIKLVIDDLGIWIDPIDSTAEYIHGIEKIDQAAGVNLSGLRCVTVLIGVFNKKTGSPVMGVINQPFYENNGSTWKGNFYWGLSFNDIKISSLNNDDKIERNLVVLSGSESLEIKEKLLNNGFKILEVAGAGYKLLTVISGLVDAYILSKGSTFRWDTCAPQAILNSLNGGVVDFVDFLGTDSSSRDNFNLKYLPEDNNDFCNRGGLIAYRNIRILESLKQILCE